MKLSEIMCTEYTSTIVEFRWQGYTRFYVSSFSKFLKSHFVQAVSQKRFRIDAWNFLWLWIYLWNIFSHCYFTSFLNDFLTDFDETFRDFCTLVSIKEGLKKPSRFLWRYVIFKILKKSFCLGLFCKMFQDKRLEISCAHTLVILPP